MGVQLEVLNWLASPLVDGGPQRMTTNPEDLADLLTEVFIDTGTSPRTCGALPTAPALPVHLLCLGAFRTKAIV